MNNYYFLVTVQSAADDDGELVTEVKERIYEALKDIGPVSVRAGA